MVRNGLKWSKMVYNACKLPKMTGNGRNYDSDHAKCRGVLYHDSVSCILGPRDRTALKIVFCNFDLTKKLPRDRPEILVEGTARDPASTCRDLDLDLVTFDLDIEVGKNRIFAVQV